MSIYSPAWSDFFSSIERHVELLLYRTEIGSILKSICNPERYVQRMMVVGSNISRSTRKQSIRSLSPANFYACLEIRHTWDSTLCSIHAKLSILRVWTLDALDLDSTSQFLRVILWILAWSIVGAQTKKSFGTFSCTSWIKDVLVKDGRCFWPFA